MIPARLEIHNFMPYPADVPPFSFAGLHTACICGDNGSGKSALVDAITWALWGKTRAKSDDELIHLGENETEVSFDFSVSGQLYRVVRKHALPKKSNASGQSSLDLFLLNGETVKVLTADTKGQTQQKIIDILHIDYDTFVNSAFLRQGHAGEFTQQRPAKRKEVLASILNLEVYDQLEQQAREKAREAELEKTVLENTVRNIGDELEQQASVETALKEAEGKLAGVDSQTTAAFARLSELRQEAQSLTIKKQELLRLDGQIAKGQKDIERWRERLKQGQARATEAEALIAKRAEIEEGSTRHGHSTQQNEELNQKQGLLISLNDKKVRLEKAVETAKSEILREHALSQQRMADLTAKTPGIDELANKQKALANEAEKLAAAETALAEKRQIASHLQTKLASLEADRRYLAVEISQIDEKLALLSEREDAHCPLCETELGSRKIELVNNKYATEKAEKTARVATLDAEIKQAAQTLEAERQALSALEASVGQQKASLKGREDFLKKEASEAAEAKEKLALETKRLAATDDKLKLKNFAATEQKELASVINEISKLGYNPEAHHQARQQLRELAKYEGLRHKLEAAEQLIAQEKKNATEATEAILEIESQLQADEKTKIELSGQLGKEPQVAASLSQAEAEHQTLSQEQKQAQQAIGSLAERLKQYHQLREKIDEKKQGLKKAQETETVYRELATAFGKKGIQAMLIEMALPEIEAETNRLLGRMTDNRMQVKLESQRQSKKGDVLETLDIKISDELGTRNYEMYSGGEAFRIDFALRIALSKLLAGRAGAPLPTLIIDEGFGTQDNNGMEKLKEAINSIQDDFEKILVITHMDELKDSFPTRIEVVKTAKGSTIQVGQEV